MYFKKVLRYGLRVFVYSSFLFLAVHLHAYKYYVKGNSGDVIRTTSPGLMLMGGGADVDDAFRWMISKSGGGDFVVIRCTGTDAYNSYIYSLGTLDSVETLIISSRKDASKSFVVDKIRKAEALFIAGGDQYDYYRYWKDTPVEDAIHYLRDRGVPIGGTSAGFAVLGEFLYTAENGTVYSSEALADPYNRYMTLGKDFLLLPYMSKVITDSHFVTRDRMGRLLAFMARIIKDGWSSSVKGIGVDEETAVCVESDGAAIIKGDGYAYFLSASKLPEVCIPKTPLTFLNIPVYKVSRTGTFNFATWSGSGGVSYAISAENGVLSSTQTGGKIY
ncbi:MAG: cyanophycinase [Candidatus Aminicenantia bacterium]